MTPPATATPSARATPRSAKHSAPSRAPSAPAPSAPKPSSKPSAPTAASSPATSPATATSPRRHPHAAGPDQSRTSLNTDLPGGAESKEKVGPNGVDTATEGAPQGASASPLLANDYLHYVFDLSAKWCRTRYAHGDVIFVRFADDFIAGFEHHADAQRFLADLGERFAKFGLDLHDGKTRLIEFGRHAARRRKARGLGKPATS